MPLDSITERTFVRSRHFGGATKDEALRQSQFYQEQIAYYLANVFQDAAYTIECTQRFDTDRVFTIRKGSALLLVENVFGINTSYKEQPPRKFYTFTTTVTHRNETLDTTEKINDVIEWTCRITAGLILGSIIALVLIMFGGHLGLHLITIGFGIGSAVGSFIGQHIARRIYERMEKRLEKKGEITEIEAEWTALTETVALVYNVDSAESSIGDSESENSADWRAPASPEQLTNPANPIDHPGGSPH